MNLDRFTLFFPEKRPFFLENAGFFSVGNPGEVDLFFSRRIGIGDNGEADSASSAAAASRARPGAFNVGLLNMQTDDYRGSAAEQQLHASCASAATCRTARRSAGSSSIGRAPATWRRDDDHNRTYAVDGKWGIGQNTVLSSFVARTETPGVDDDDYAFNVRSRTNVPRFDLELGYQEVGDSFNPEVGFLSRRGYRKPDARVLTRFRPKDFLNLQELRPHVVVPQLLGPRRLPGDRLRRTSTTTGSSATPTKCTPA